MWNSQSFLNYQTGELYDKRKQMGRQERCLLVSINVRCKEWKIHTLGLQLNTIKAFTSVDHGPL